MDADFVTVDIFVVVIDVAVDVSVFFYAPDGVVRYRLSEVFGNFTGNRIESLTARLLENPAVKLAGLGPRDSLRIEAGEQQTIDIYSIIDLSSVDEVEQFQMIIGLKTCWLLSFLLCPSFYVILDY